MSLLENLANAYSSSPGSSSEHAFLAKKPDGKYTCFKTRAQAKKKDAKVVSAAKVLKLLAGDESGFKNLTQQEKINLKNAVDHLALRTVNNESSKGLKEKIRNLFRRICCKLRDKNYQKIMKALGGMSQENKIPILSNVFESSHRNVNKATLEFDAPASPKPLKKVELSDVFESSDELVGNASKTRLEFDAPASPKPSIRVADPRVKSADGFSSSPKPLEKVEDFKADFDEMFSSSKNPRFSFDESKLEEYGITLEDLQLIHYFHHSDIPKGVKLRVDSGYSVTTCSQVKDILKVGKTSAEVLTCALATLQQDLVDQGKEFFCIMNEPSSDGKITFTAPGGKILSLEEYQATGQKAVCIKYLHGHYTLISLDPSKEQVLFYDSMDGVGKAPHRENKKFLDELAKELGWTVVVEEGPKQFNVTDCGLFCYQQARNFFNVSDKSDFKQEDMAYVRLQAVSSYLKNSRFLGTEKTKWFETRLKTSAKVYYLNRTIPPAKVQLLKECLEGKREPKGITKAQLEALIDERKIPASLIPKIQDHIDDLKEIIRKVEVPSIPLFLEDGDDIPAEDGPQIFMTRIPSREKIDATSDEAEKEKLLLQALQDLYNYQYDTAYTLKGKELKDEFCVMLALLFVN